MDVDSQLFCLSVELYDIFSGVFYLKGDEVENWRLFRAEKVVNDFEILFREEFRNIDCV